MGLYKKGRNWFIDYRYPPGRTGHRVRERVGPNKSDAEILLGERLQDIRQGKNPSLRKVTPVLFRDHAKEVLAQHYSKKRSHEWAKLVTEVHLVPFFGDAWLGFVDPRKVSEYVTRRLGEGVTHGTVNNERAVLSKIMSLGIEWGRIHENPVRKVKKLEQSAGRERFLTEAEAEKLLGKAAKHLKPILVAALETGGRLSEILGLRWEDVHLDQGFLVFDQTNTKSGKRREIPVTPALSEVLSHRRKLRSIAGDAREFVFTRFGNRLEGVRTSFEHARKDAGLGEDVTFHTLRHTFASWFMQRGGDLFLLRDLLGHQDIKTTMRYAHLSPTYRRSAVPLMGRQTTAPRKKRGHSVDTNGGSDRNAADQGIA